MKILIAGDYVPMGRVAEHLKGDDYAAIFDQVKTITAQSDYSIVNLEAPIVIHEALPIEKTGPNLKCTEKAISSLRYAGFDCVTLANNHLRDYGNDGVKDTIDSCKEGGIDYVGAGNNIEEAYAILYRRINDKSIAVINVCETEWSIAGENSPGAAPLNVVKVSRQIQEAKSNADFVLLIIHGGVEQYNLPTPRMVETYRFFIDMGADAIVNHHQHCYSGYELYNNKPIFYGLGNFCFDKNNDTNGPWNQGYMVCLNFESNRIDYELFPYVQCAYSSSIELMSGEERSKFLGQISNLNNVISDYSLLSNAFDKHIHRIKEWRLLEFEPFSNKYIRALQLKRIVPSLISKKTRKNIFNNVICDTHREIVIKIWSDDYFN